MQKMELNDNEVISQEPDINIKLKKDEYWQKEAQDKQSVERENKVLILQQRIFTKATRYSK